MRACASDGKWTGRNDTHCEDVTPPTFANTCPSDKVFHLGSCSSNITVNWTRAVATDNSGTVNVRGPSVQSPFTLTSGIHTINYTAEDQSGNSRSCVFKIQVIRKFCRILSPPSNGLITSLTCGHSFGSVAFIGCQSGYHINGDTERTCVFNGQWSDVSTTCIRVTCPSLTSLKFGTVEPRQCTTGLPVVSGTLCVFKCNFANGFQNDGPAYASCTANGTWSADVNQISCKDVRPPQLQCPQDVAISTDAGKAFATLSWTVPIPIDNSGENLKLTTKPGGISPPYQFSLGHNVIRYITRDSTGLQNSCSFVVTVRDTEPPTKVRCPQGMTIKSKEGRTRIYLPPAVFKDNVRVTSISTDLVNGTRLSWGDYKVTYTAMDQAGNTAKCILKITITSKNACQRPTPPKNGALACDNIHAGMHCTVHCNPGYVFSLPMPLYICSATTGKWLFGRLKPSIPDCSAASTADIEFEGDLYYLTENCSEQNPHEVRQKFKDIIKSILHGYCMIASECRLENVQVTCSDAAARRRRSTDNKQSLKIHFEMKIPFPTNSSSNISTTLVEVQSSLFEMINKSVSNFEVNGVRLTLSKSSTLRVVSLSCGEAQVLTGTKCGKNTD
ncbi:hypothetical protein QZH41_008705 [Actinostola sp. cb2023]|nr:hypothetical protein QZH41_008705 [Actinostola sp. cb2023]